MAKYYDTLLGEYIKNPGARGLSLDDLASRYFDYKMISYDEITNKKKLEFNEVDLENAAIYSGEDVYISWELYKKQKEEEREQGQEEKQNILKLKNPPNPLYQGGKEQDSFLEKGSQRGGILENNNESVIPADAGIYKNEKKHSIDPRVKHEDDDIYFQSSSKLQEKQNPPNPLYQGGKEQDSFLEKESQRGGILENNNESVIPADAGIYKNEKKHSIDPRAKHEDDDIYFQSSSKLQEKQNFPNPLYQGGTEQDQAPLIKGEANEVSRGIISKNKSQKLNSEFSILYDIEIPLLEVLKDMEINGVKIDRDKLKGIGILLENEINNLEKEIYSLAGVEFNIKSPKQVGEILFEKLGLPSSKKTKTGFSVDSEVLDNLGKKYDIAKKIVDYRTYAKLLSTYVEGLLGELDENDLIHTSFNQTIASTGRLSSTNPNLQNIPVGEGIAGEIREAFIPFSDQEIIMAFDYSQVEVRILAILSGDENLLNAFKNNLDIHQNTAKFIFGKENISKNERKIAKAVNFGVIYGISAFGLSKMIDSGVGESKKYIDKFYENYPKVRDFFDKIILDCQEKGYVETLFGRKRFISGINDRNRIIQEAAKREAINMPIQGSAADIIKLAMIEIQDFLKEKKLFSKMIMQVHDELVFSVKKEEKEILENKIKFIMENILNNYKSRIVNYKLDEKKIIPLIVDIGVGKNRGEAK